MAESRSTFIGLLFVLALAQAVSIRAQVTDSLRAETDSTSAVEMVLRDAILLDSIGAVRLGPSGLNKDWPFISLINTLPLELLFDDLRNDYTEFRYDIIHCDRNWVSTGQQLNDYYSGFPAQVIEDVSFSSATKKGYATYRLVFPPPDENFIQSGNYILQVYETGSGTVVMRRRFVVIDPQVNVKAEVIPPVETRFRKYKQELKFKILDGKGLINDMNALFVVALKNNNWDLSCSNFKPSFISGSEIVFENNQNCLFDGGNEYRDVNFINFKTLSMDITTVRPARHASYDLYMEDDHPRSYLQYSYTKDMNGAMDLKGQQKTYVWTEQDYAILHFSLKTDEAMLGYEIFLNGDLCKGRADSLCKMEFNVEKGKYEQQVLLKQGYYNYQYVVRSPYQEGPDETLIEGNHFETENDYTLLIYFRSALEGYDMMIGMEQINSTKKLDE